MVARFGKRLARSISGRKASASSARFSVRSQTGRTQGGSQRAHALRLALLRRGERRRLHRRRDVRLPVHGGRLRVPFDLVERAGRLDLAMNVPKSLPMFYIAGAEDPWAFGDGVRDAVEVMRSRRRRRHQDQAVPRDAPRDPQRGRPEIKCSKTCWRGSRVTGREGLNGEAGSWKIRHRARSGDHLLARRLVRPRGIPIASVQRPFPRSTLSRDGSSTTLTTYCRPSSAPSPS